MMDCVVDHPYRSGRFGGSGAIPLRPGGFELTRHAAWSAGFAEDQRILDLGCGEGKGTQVLCELGCRVVGIDVSRSSLVTAATHLGDLLPVVAGAGRLPFADASFDGIIAECALSLVERRCAALAECYRVLRPDGRLVITDVFAHNAAIDDSSAPACLAGMTTRDEILDELAYTGFRVDRWEDHSAVLRSFMARLIFESDSPDGLFGRDDATVNAALRQRRPGYFLLIASKAGEEGIWPMTPFA